MPFIDSKISVPITEEKKQIIKDRLGKAIELIPGKSEQWLMVGFDNNYSLYFQGKDSGRIAFVEVKLFGGASDEAYNNLTGAICNIFEQELEIPSDKIYITYEEISSWGWNGSNFL